MALALSHTKSIKGADLVKIFLGGGEKYFNAEIFAGDRLGGGVRAGDAA